jgi:hypothetical protein
MRKGVFGWLGAVWLGAFLPGVASCGTGNLPMCTDGEGICNAAGTATFLCKNATWDVSQVCDVRTESCVARAGHAVCACRGSTEGCTEDRKQARQCVSGTWVVGAACASTESCTVNLEDGKAVCVPTGVACDPARDTETCKLVSQGSTPKNGADAYWCTQTGRWEVKQACAETQICLILLASSADGGTREEAACRQIPCQEGLEYCPSISAKGNPHICTSGVMQLKDTCASDEGCIVLPGGQAVCLSFKCTDGEESCSSSGVPYQCVDGGSNAKKTCSPQEYCYVKDRVADCMEFCVPNTTQCASSSTVQKCEVSGKWSEVAVCTVSQECVVSKEMDAGGGAATASCRNKL